MFEAYRRRTTATWLPRSTPCRAESAAAVQPRDPGAWSDSSGFRASAQVHDDDFKACVALQAQYIFDTFGKFPGTVPSVFIMNYVQAHHLDLEFYDRYFKPGAYLHTHAEHMETWHGQRQES